jgi:hypothetical protein
MLGMYAATQRRNGMPDDTTQPPGRTVRDPARSAEVIGRPIREGELEVFAEKVQDWTANPATIKPSRDKAQEIHGALKKALQDQLLAEADSIGADPDTLALHGRTGISTMPEELQQ